MNKEIYEEYVKEHPEEVSEINQIKAKSDRIHAALRTRKRKRLAEIDKYRRILDGEYTK